MIATAVAVIVAAARDDRAASLLEYAMLAGFIAAVCLAAIGIFGHGVWNLFDTSNAAIGTTP